jgi:hypothetical protein
MSIESGMHRRKFLEIGIYTLTGTMAALSTFVLARFAVEKKRVRSLNLTIYRFVPGFDEIVSLIA